ncbi:MAG TPA: pyrroloquinoline quinone biosynthesis peptide chaperone PqqD [Glaciecola sp.]|jgi:pyrroloquinoline quinone biosynthesis protein D|nr:pyrroloquinoline quinone biosynthesis peptide chaperone PqqD [Glaciecola sp.]
MITPSMQPKLNAMFRLQWEPAQDCHVLLFPEGMVKLNGGAAEILKLVDGANNVADIVALLQQKFPEANDLTDDVHEFLITAQQKKWLYYEK